MGSKNTLNRKPRRQKGTNRTTLSVYNHLRSDAWKTFNALEAARIAREL